MRKESNKNNDKLIHLSRFLFGDTSVTFTNENPTQTEKDMFEHCSASKQKSGYFRMIHYLREKVFQGIISKKRQDMYNMHKNRYEFL